MITNMKPVSYLIFLGLSFFYFGLGLASSQSGAAPSGASQNTHSGDRVIYHLKGSVTTLYPRDPVAASLCFTDGKDGLVLESNEIRNRCSHLRIEQASVEAVGREEYLAVGVQGGQEGFIIDLGEEQELTGKYGYHTWPGRAFSSILINDGKVMILRDIRQKLYAEIEEAAPMYTMTANERGNQGRKVIKVGHIYLARIVDRNEKSYGLWVKMLVLAHSPGQTVTLRWQVL